jgi:hypothetical protein
MGFSWKTSLKDLLAPEAAWEKQECKARENGEHEFADYLRTF